MTGMRRIIQVILCCISLSGGFAFAVDSTSATPSTAATAPEAPNTTTTSIAIPSAQSSTATTPASSTTTAAPSHSFGHMLSQIKAQIIRLVTFLKNIKAGKKAAATTTTAPAPPTNSAATPSPATTNISSNPSAPVAAISSASSSPLADQSSTGQKTNTTTAVPTDGTPLGTYIKNNDSSSPQNQNQNQRITLDFANIPSRELIQVFAQFTGLNFIVSDNVKGNSSVHLTNIPWQQALDAILKSEGLDQRRIGNAIIIAPIDEIADQEAKELEAQQKIEEIKYKNQIDNLQSVQRIEDLQPLVNRVITLNYAKATDIKDLLTKDGSLLSPRGKVGVDTPSNSVWIRDTETYTDSLARLIKRLDSPVRQVLIEARIVKIDRPYEKSLGIRWGVTSVENNLSGNLVGANYLVGGLPSSAVTPVLTDRLNFNTPAASLNNGTLLPATVGLALAKLGNFNIDLEVSALEYEGKLETISKPRLVTSNLQTAKISTGEEIPYNESTSSGATSIAFKEASLSLEVTPRITPDNRVILTLKVANDQQGNSVPVGTGTAVTIDTEQEESQVLVDNNQTIVLGGVFKLDKNKTVTRIPFLGQIPIIGYLFKQTIWKNTRSELLIFLTPKIINKPSDLNEG